MVVTIFIFVALIALLIFIHEAGHFFAARRAGVKVEEFGFGFPPRIFGIRKGETLYSLNWIPLGGFVKIFGEEGEGAEDLRSFSSRGVGVRAIIIAAGVLMNLLLAIALFSGGHMIGLPTVADENQPIEHLSSLQIQVIDVAEDSPATDAGLAIGDVILGADGKRFKTIDAVQAYVGARAGQEITLEILHDNSAKTLTVTPRQNPPEGQGPIGFAMVRTGIQKLPWHAAIVQGAKDAFLLSWLLLEALWGLLAALFTTGQVSSDVAGPVGIAVLVGRVAKLGIAHLLQFAGAISVNLALINAFPIPALDGGRLLFLLIEKIKGSPVSRLIEQKIHQVGFTFLLMLMALITVRDVVRLF